MSVIGKLQPFFRYLAVVAFLLGSVPFAQATVTFEFQLGSVPLPTNSLGVLVVDAAGDGFISPGDSAGTILSPGGAMGGSDDIIVAVFPITSAAPFAPDAGFVELVGPLDYEALGLEEGQALNFFAIPGRSPGDSLRSGETFVSFRTDDAKSLIGNMGFTLPSDGGSYVLGAIGSELGGSTDFTGLLPDTPLIGIDDRDDLIVGKDFVLQVEANGDPLRYVIRGLPPGLRYDATTGLITGRFRRGGSYQFRVWVRNASGTSGPIVVPLEVAALPDEMIGNFQGLVERDADINESLGGRLVLRTSPNGRLSGRLFLGGRSYGFRSDLEMDMDSGVPVDPSANIQVNRRGMPSVELGLNFDLDAETFSGAVSEGTVNADVTGFHHSWHPRLNRPQGYEGNYTNLLDLDPAQGLEGDPDVPQGNGFARLTVLRSGTVRWVGKLADGAPLSFSGSLGPEGQYYLFRTLYRHTGSVVGAGAIHLDPGSDGDFNDNTVSGEWDWMKLAQSNPRVRNYRDGFGVETPVVQLVAGERYFPPARGEILLGFPEGEGNAQLIFAEGGLVESEMNPDLAFAATAGVRGIVPRPGSDENPTRTVFVVNRRTGLFRGSFLLQDTNEESGTVFRRRAVYQGILRPSQNMGAGLFLLGQLPDAVSDPPTNLRTSPILSGQVVLQASE